MNDLTVEEIQERWNSLIDIIETNFEGTRKENILEMYSYFRDRICTAPAAGRLHYHGAYVGGYLDHILTITKTAGYLFNLYKNLGGLINFSYNELIFAVLHHDFGKLGDLDHEYYIPGNNDWQRKNNNEIFTHNKELQYMSVPHRAIWMLQHFKIDFSEQEMIGILLADGLFDEGTKEYHQGFGEFRQLRTGLPLLVHWADWISTSVERDQYRKFKIQENERIKKVLESNPQPPSEFVQSKEIIDLKNTLDDLFKNEEKEL